MFNLVAQMGCRKLTYSQKTTSKTESTPIFEMGVKQGSDYYLLECKCQAGTVRGNIGMGLMGWSWMMK
jgi:hypothetical protein